MSRSPTSCCPADQGLCTRGKGRGSRPACADSTGAYTITGLGTNDYKLEVYDAAPGYARTFYPGVSTYQKASTVTLTAGQASSGVNITVPRA